MEPIEKSVKYPSEDQTPNAEEIDDANPTNRAANNVEHMPLIANPPPTCPDLPSPEKVRPIGKSDVVCRASVSGQMTGAIPKNKQAIADNSCASLVPKGAAVKEKPMKNIKHGSTSSKRCLPFAAPINEARVVPSGRSDRLALVPHPWLGRLDQKSTALTCKRTRMVPSYGGVLRGRTMGAFSRRHSVPKKCSQEFNFLAVLQNEDCKFVVRGDYLNNFPDQLRNPLVTDFKREMQNLLNLFVQEQVQNTGQLDIAHFENRLEQQQARRLSLLFDKIDLCSVTYGSEQQVVRYKRPMLDAKGSTDDHHRQMCQLNKPHGAEIMLREKALRAEFDQAIAKKDATIADLKSRLDHNENVHKSALRQLNKKIKALKKEKEKLQQVSNSPTCARVAEEMNSMKETQATFCEKLQHIQLAHKRDVRRLNKKIKVLEKSNKELKQRVGYTTSEEKVEQEEREKINSPKNTQLSAKNSSSTTLLTESQEDEEMMKETIESIIDELTAFQDEHASLDEEANSLSDAETTLDKTLDDNEIGDESTLCELKENDQEVSQLRGELPQRKRLLKTRHFKKIKEVTQLKAMLEESQNAYAALEKELKKIRDSQVEEKKNDQAEVKKLKQENYEGAEEDSPGAQQNPEEVSRLRRTIAKLKNQVDEQKISIIRDKCSIAELLQQLKHNSDMKDLREELVKTVNQNGVYHDISECNTETQSKYEAFQTLCSNLGRNQVLLIRHEQTIKLLEERNDRNELLRVQLQERIASLEHEVYAVKRILRRHNIAFNNGP